MADLRVRPLDVWPRERARHHRRSPFASSWSATVDLLGRELRHLSARNAVILVDCSASDIRVDGTMPKASARVGYPGVVVAFDSVHGPLKYLADEFSHWQDNVRAIALGLEALRRVERYGITSRGEQYTGWAQLPSGIEAPAGRMTFEEAAAFIAEHARCPVEGVRSAPTTAYRVAARRLHPDTGGDEREFQRLQEAKRVLDEAVTADG